MKRICCQCGTYLGEKPGPVELVTHGYCEPCKEKVLEQLQSARSTSSELPLPGGKEVTASTVDARR